jgi:hypothetical protein
MSTWHVSTTHSGCISHRVPTIICIILIFISTCLWFYRRKERDSKPHGSNLLIIDGCNGPLKLNKISLLDESRENISFRNKCISLLRIQGGEVKSDLVFLLQNKVLKLLFNNRHLALDTVKIFFDGRGMKEIQNRSWQNFDYSNKKNTVQVIITHQNDEADDVIVRLVQQRIKHPPQIHSSLLDDVKSHSKVCHDDACILTLLRNEEGSGKSRRLLKPYCLVRPGSIYSLPFMTPEVRRQSLHDLHKLLHNNSKLFQNYVQRRILNKNNETIVVTDDVYLRQRVLVAGGVVLTFEQLWSLLS